MDMPSDGSAKYVVHTVMCMSSLPVKTQSALRVIQSIAMGHGGGGRPAAQLACQPVQM